MCNSRADEKLVHAASELLVEVGPHGATVRSIAARAGVNHGLVHHYFGSKEQLMRAAMISLLEQHQEFVKREGGGSPIPLPMLLLEQNRYLRAVAQCLLDGAFDLALLEVTEGLSVPRAALHHSLNKSGKSLTVEIKSAFCAAMAFEMGWVLFEPFMFAVTDMSSDEVQDARQIAARVRQSMAKMAV
jgi:AcrR family transcriptional regulator